MIETELSIYVSPVTILAHEAAHAVKYDDVLNSFNKEQQLEYIISIKKGIEEMRVITGPEQDAARKHGEIRIDSVTRSNHTGGIKYILVPTQISVEELSELIYERNNLL